MENIKILSGQLESHSDDPGNSGDFEYERFNRLIGELNFRIANLVYREEKILIPLAVNIIPFSVQDKLISEVDSYGSI
jgi:hypothetical protein